MGFDFLMFSFSCLVLIYSLYRFILIVQTPGHRKISPHQYYMLTLAVAFCLSETVDLFELPWKHYVYVILFVALIVIGTSALIKGLKIYMEKRSLKAIPDELYILTALLVVILFTLF